MRAQRAYHFLRTEPMGVPIREHSGRERFQPAGVLETRRGVGSFVSAAGPDEARPSQERTRRLRAFVTRVLADADAAGFTIADVVAELASHRHKGA